MTSMRETVRIAALGLLTGVVLVLAVYAPRPVLSEVQFVLLVLLATLFTRSLPAEYGLSTFGLGLGATVFLVIGAGRAMTAAGLDTGSGPANLVLIPLLEEALKLVPVALIAWLHARRHRLTPNPSDLLMLGCCAGAGFALAENVTLVYRDAALAATDMSLRYGPSVGPLYLVPGAWGVAGYTGHAAATGFIAGGVGIGQALRHRLGSRWWLVPAACAIWIAIEHMLGNLYLETGSRRALWLANGRITPWLFVLMAVSIVRLDRARYQTAFAQSARLRRRLLMTRAAMRRTRPPVPRSRINAVRLYVSQLRLVNATAWFTRNRRRIRSDRRAAMRPAS